jgi:murein DD-endopeptidase MepM/ murein hydrolase activator NlpD
MRTVLAIGLVSAGLYASVLGLAPAPAQTLATASAEVTSDGAAQEAGPESGAAPSDAPEPTATPVESATPEAPEPAPSPSPPEPEASPSPPPPAASPEAGGSPASQATPAPPAATPEPAAAASPEPGVPVTPAKPRTHPAAAPRGRVNATARDGDVRPPAESRRAGSPQRLPGKPTLTVPDGSPAPSNPDFALAIPGQAPIGVPDFFIDKFRIPPFLLPIYQAAGVQYGVRWEVLAAINEIETDYGRNLNVSSAGAVGWMQFMPSTWEAYGVDASGDGLKDPFNPVDAIFAAARYLQASGAEDDIRGALFAYNHADWYVDSVLLRAQLLGRLPRDLVGSLTGLTEGRFPVRARARYAGSDDGSAIRIYARAGAPVVAAANGRVLRIGRSRSLGRHLVLQDVYGNTYTYANLGSVLDIDTSTPKGVRVVGGTVIGRVGGSTGAPHLRFEIRPAGRGAPQIDPKPILDGWKLLESSATYRAKGRNPFFGADAETPTVGQLLLLSKEQLIQRVLHDRRIEVYGCGIGDIRSGHIDRRVLATMLYLAASGLKPTISSLRCGHSYLTASGNVSEHSTGTAIDIAAVNDIAIQPSTQGPGSITDMTIQALLQLQGTLKPHQIISLMTFEGADNTVAMGDHHDHIHVGWRPKG